MADEDESDLLDDDADLDDAEGGEESEEESKQVEGEEGASNSESLLSDEELEALREAESDDAPALGGGSMYRYDFRDPAHVLANRLPGLDSVNERLILGLQASIGRVMRQPAQVLTTDVSMSKLIDYRNSLPVPASTHAVQMLGRDAVVLITLEAALVFMLVDGYYGGSGRALDVVPEREFSGTEKRIIDRSIVDFVQNLYSAWVPVAQLPFGEVQDTRALSYAPGIKLDEILVVSRFTVQTEQSSGELHVAMPYSVLDELRPLLVNGGGDALASDMQWREGMVSRMAEVPISIKAVLAEASVPLSELMTLKPGDFIPIRQQEHITLLAEEMPLFEAKPGARGTMSAATISRAIGSKMS